jgi:hypothetical protein
MSSLDRLALVCRVLLDSRFLELKRENERLKLSLFWVDHSINTLKKLMAHANNRAGGPRCRCGCCMRTKRSRPSILDGYDDDEREETCSFGPWFQRVLQAHGLSFAHGGDAFPCELDRELYPKPHVDVHFNIVGHPQYTTWVVWMYGARLWGAQTTDDPELAKLAALFKTLGSDPDCLLFDTHDSDAES